MDSHVHIIIIVMKATPRVVCVLKVTVFAGTEIKVRRRHIRK